ncbi:MAG: PilZ domain-containing protein [Terriglobales bacterium]|jgi:PilZ domain-containing protein
MAESSPEDDRRRSPRFSCTGRAEINCLPSSGILLTGTIRDLSLHGCCVDTSLPIDCGARAEIVVRVNAASFRAVSEVRAIRGRSSAALEFVRLSAGGKDSLSGLVTDLARLQAIMNKLKSVRREMSDEAFRKELKKGKLHAEMLSARFPFTGITLQPETAESYLESPPGDKNRDADSSPFVIAVNLFG